MFRTIRRPLFAVFTLMAALMFVGAAWAQDEPVPGAGGRGRMKREPGERRTQTERPDRGGMRETVMLVFVDGLRKHLDLSNEETLELLPLFEELEQHRERHDRTRRQKMMELRGMVEDPAASDGDLSRLMTELKVDEQAFRDTEEKLQQKINARLDTRQQAKLIFFQTRFRDRLRKAVERRREERRQLRQPTEPGERGPRPGPGPFRDRDNRREGP